MTLKRCTHCVGAVCVQNLRQANILKVIIFDGKVNPCQLFHLASAVLGGVSEVEILHFSQSPDKLMLIEHQWLTNRNQELTRIARMLPCRAPRIKQHLGLHKKGVIQAESSERHQGLRCAPASKIKTKSVSMWEILKLSFSQIARQRLYAGILSI